MLSFAAAVFLLMITPGPGVLSVAGVGSGYGMRPGLRYTAGLFVGTNIVAAAVVAGAAALVLANPALRTALMVLSVGYLCWLAAKIALAGSRIGFAAAARAPGFANGVALQLVNPKAYVVHATLFTGFAFLPDRPGAEVALKFLLMNVIWIPVHLAWLALGIWLRRLQPRASVQRAINVGMAAAMLAVVGLAIWSGRGA
jgi:threonine/homoserine/homoserine lactone efflux protein